MPTIISCKDRPAFPYNIDYTRQLLYRYCGPPHDHSHALTPQRFSIRPTPSMPSVMHRYIAAFDITLNALAVKRNTRLGFFADLQHFTYPFCFGTMVILPYAAHVDP